jgi:hypothetical protein
MKFGERILVFFLRPVYRALFEGPLADITARLQSIERLSAQLRDAEANLAAQMHNLRAELVPYLQRAQVKNAELAAQLGTVDANSAARLGGIEASNVAQWDAVEQLLHALFRLPESQAAEADSKANTPEETAISGVASLNRMHAASNLR